MVELLRYLEGAGFTTLIASGGDRDFMRPIAAQLYGIPPERVIGSSLTLDYGNDGRVVKKGLDVLRRRAGEARPDLEPHRSPARSRRRQLERRHPDAALRRRRRRRPLRLLVRHDDGEREFAYDAGAEEALAPASRSSR